MPVIVERAELCKAQVPEAWELKRNDLLNSYRFATWVLMILYALKMLNSVIFNVNARRFDSKNNAWGIYKI